MSFKPIIKQIKRLGKSCSFGRLFGEVTRNAQRVCVNVARPGARMTRARAPTYFCPREKITRCSTFSQDISRLNVLFRIEINLSHILIVSRAVSHVAMLMPTAQLLYQSDAKRQDSSRLAVGESAQAPSAKCLSLRS